MPTMPPPPPLAQFVFSDILSDLSFSTTTISIDEFLRSSAIDLPDLPLTPETASTPTDASPLLAHLKSAKSSPTASTDASLHSQTYALTTDLIATAARLEGRRAGVEQIGREVEALHGDLVKVVQTIEARTVAVEGR